MSTSAAVRQRVTILASVAVVLTGLNGGWLGPFLPGMAEAQGVPLDRIGLLVSAKFLGFMLAVMGAGRLLDRWGGRVALPLALALMGVGQFGIAMLPGMPALLASGLVLGLGFGVLDVGSQVVIVHLNRARMAAALNYLNAAFAVGALAGPLVAGLALQGGVPYRAVYGAGAALAALLALLFAATPLPHQRPGETHAPREGTRLLAAPVIWGLGSVLLLYVAVEAALGAWLFTYLRRSGGLEAAPASWSVALFWLGLVVGRALGGWLVGRITIRGLTIGGVALATVGLATLAFGPARLALALPAALLIGAGIGPVYPNVIATGATLFPRQVSAMASRLITFASLGGIVGPWLVGRSLVLAGPRQAMALVCAMSLGMLAAFLVTGRALGKPMPAAALPPAEASSD